MTTVLDEEEVVELQQKLSDLKVDQDSCLRDLCATLTGSMTASMIETTSDLLSRTINPENSILTLDVLPNTAKKVIQKAKLIAKRDTKEAIELLKKIVHDELDGSQVKNEAQSLIENLEGEISDIERDYVIVRKEDLLESIWEESSSPKQESEPAEPIGILQQMLHFFIQRQMDKEEEEYISKHDSLFECYKTMMKKISDLLQACIVLGSKVVSRKPEIATKVLKHVEAYTVMIPKMLLANAVDVSGITLISQLLGLALSGGSYVLENNHANKAYKIGRLVSSSAEASELAEKIARKLVLRYEPQILQLTTFKRTEKALWHKLNPFAGDPVEIGGAQMLAECVVARIVQVMNDTKIDLTTRQSNAAAHVEYMAQQIVDLIFTEPISDDFLFKDVILPTVIPNVKWTASGLLQQSGIICVERGECYGALSKDSQYCKNWNLYGFHVGTRAQAGALKLHKISMENTPDIFLVTQAKQRSEKNELSKKQFFKELGSAIQNTEKKRRITVTGQRIKPKDIQISAKCTLKELIQEIVKVYECKEDFEIERVICDKEKGVAVDDDQAVSCLQTNDILFIRL